MYDENNQHLVPSVLERWMQDKPATLLEENTFNWVNKNEDAFLFLIDISQMAVTDRGYQKWSIAGAVEIIRWDHPEIVTNKGGFHLCNSYRATLARMINEYLEFPLFKTRAHEGHVYDY